MNRETISLPDYRKIGRKISLLRSISAVQLVDDEHGGAKLGGVSQLGPGSKVQCCGDGFDQYTVKVRAKGRIYFVFLEDLESQRA